MDTDIRDAYRRPGEIGQNEREMTGARDHRVLAVGLALIGAAGGDMNVRDDAQSAPPPGIPKRAEISVVQANDTGVQRAGIEIVVENEIDDAGSGAVTAAKQKSAALPAVVAAPLA